MSLVIGREVRRGDARKEWVRDHLQTPEKMSNLRPGEAFIWSSKATDEAFTKGAVKIRCRPRATHHGGATKTAVDG